MNNNNNNNEVDILILSTYDQDGAGLHSIYQKNLLKKLGYKVSIICAEKLSEDEETKGILIKGDWELLKYKIKRRIHRYFLNEKSKRYSFVHSYEINENKVLKSNAWPNSCKLIICNYLSGMFSFKTLYKVWLRYKKIPIIFYGVDMELYTGGCHYSRECLQYKQLCKKCPAFKLSKSKKIENNFLQKHKYLNLFKKHLVVASSEEMKIQLKESYLFSSSDIRKILMPTDSKIFGNSCEHQRIRIRTKNGFEKKFVIMIRSSSEERKGCYNFIKAINYIEKDNPEKYQSIQLIAVGDDFIKSKLSNKNISLFYEGFVKDFSKLADLYVASDVFINTSLADSGPSMLSQAAMTGTSIISTNVGLAHDLISTNGIILKNNGYKELVNAIYKIMKIPKSEQSKNRIKARNSAFSLLNEEKYLNTTKDLMNEFLGNKN